MLKLGKNVDFSKFKKMTVYDSDGISLGKIIDFVFTDQYTLSKFILGGSFLEEIKEKIGLKPDDDPVISVSDITNLNLKENKITISCKQSEISNKIQKGAFAANETLFSNYSKLRVECAKGHKLGRMVDAIFTDENEVSMVLGDSKFVEFLERIGIHENFDLLVPSKFIAKVEEGMIYLTKSHMELTTLLNNKEYVAKPQSYENLKRAQITSEMIKYSSISSLKSI